MIAQLAELPAEGDVYAVSSSESLTLRGWGADRGEGRKKRKDKGRGSVCYEDLCISIMTNNFPTNPIPRSAVNTWPVRRK